jgi:hypothetical protein
VATNIYLELTEKFNEGRLRAIISSGQAVVLHRLAIMSKDGDWILREDDESLAHVLGVLAGYESFYRFGAPLDIRWMAGGWSAHFEFRRQPLRVRTDFVTRPPRIDSTSLSRLWTAGSDWPVLGLVDLAEIKKTNREKDYAVIGELARLMSSPREQLLYSRSARDLSVLAAAQPDLAGELSTRRPLLNQVHLGRDQLERALDEERRQLIRANEERLARYNQAASRWRAAWPALEQDIRKADLLSAHQMVIDRALELLPFSP